MFGPPRPTVALDCVRPAGLLPAGPGAPGAFGRVVGGVAPGFGAGGFGTLAKAAVIAGGIGLAGAGIGGFVTGGGGGGGGSTTGPGTIEQSGAFNPLLSGESVSVPGAPLSPVIDVGEGSDSPISPDMMLPATTPTVMQQPTVFTPLPPGPTTPASTPDVPAGPGPQQPPTPPDAPAAPPAATTPPGTPVAVSEPPAWTILAMFAALLIGTRRKRPRTDLVDAS